MLILSAQAVYGVLRGIYLFSISRNYDWQSLRLFLASVFILSGLTCAVLCVDRYKNAVRYHVARVNIISDFVIVIGEFGRLIYSWLKYVENDFERNDLSFLIGDTVVAVCIEYMFFWNAFRVQKVHRRTPFGQAADFSLEKVVSDHHIEKTVGGNFERQVFEDGTVKFVNGRVLGCLSFPTYQFVLSILGLAKGCFVLMCADFPGKAPCFVNGASVLSVWLMVLFAAWLRYEYVDSVKKFLLSAGIALALIDCVRILIMWVAIANENDMWYEGLYFNKKPAQIETGLVAIEYLILIHILWFSNQLSAK